MTMTDPMEGKNKPINLRIIFTLNALKIFLTLGFFVAFKYYGFSVKGMEGESAANLMLLTMAGYILTFAAIVASILKRNLIGVRVAIIVDFLVSIPAKAPIGFAIALIGFGLTFTTSVKAYFAYQAA